MTQEFYDHIKNNLEVFNTWIDNQTRLQVSADIFKPLIPVFMEANPTVNLHGCQDCIIDMLIWCRMQYKQRPVEAPANPDKETTPKTKKKP